MDLHEIKLNNLLFRLENVQKKLNSSSPPRKNIEYLLKHIQIIKNSLGKVLNRNSNDGIDKPQSYKRFETQAFDNLIREFEEIVENSIQNFCTLNYFVHEFTDRFKGITHFYELLSTTKDRLCASNISETVYGFLFSSENVFDFNKSHLYSIKIPLHLIENIFYWPLIGHEFIHTYFYHQFDALKNDLLTQFGRNNWVKMLGNFATEMVCDGITYLLIGEIYSIMLDEYINYSETDAFFTEKSSDSPQGNQSNIGDVKLSKVSLSHPPTEIRRNFLKMIKDPEIISDDTIKMLDDYFTHNHYTNYPEKEEKKQEVMGIFRKNFKTFWTENIKQITFFDNPSEVSIKKILEVQFSRDFYSIFCPILQPISDKLKLFGLLFKLYFENREKIQQIMDREKISEVNLDALIINTSIDTFRRQIIHKFVENVSSDSLPFDENLDQNAKNTEGFLSREEYWRIINENSDRIIIDPILSTDQWKPNHVDLRLDTIFRVYQKIRKDSINKDDNEIQDQYSYIEEISVLDCENGQFVLHPGQLVLGQTFEFIKLPLDIMGFLDGRSSFGRMGIIVHATASSIDPGYQGHIAFELFNIGEMPIILYPLQRIARITFYKMPNAIKGYEGKFSFNFRPEIKNVYSDKDFIKYNSKFKELNDKIEERRKKTLLIFPN